MPKKKEAAPARAAQNNHSNSGYPISTPEVVKKDPRETVQQAIAAGNRAREQAEQRRIRREAEALENDPKFAKEWRTEQLGKLFEWVNSIFGEDKTPVLVPTFRATRKPRMKWAALDQNCLSNEEWLYNIGQVATAGGNVQVKLGPVSFDLVCIDIDDDALVEPFFKLNPKLKTTFRNKGSKGTHIWLYMAGEYPHKKRVYKDAEGRTIEFLTEGSLAMLWGYHHKTDRTYKTECLNHPVVSTFDEIIFPDGMTHTEAKEPDYENKERRAYSGAPGSRRRHGGYDFTGFEMAVQEDSGIIDILVEQYFEGAHKSDDGWRCGDISGRRAHNDGSFLIRPDGHCTEWDGPTHYPILKAICSGERATLDDGEVVSWEEVFSFIEDEIGLNFFKAPKEDGCEIENKFNLIYNAGGGDFYVPAPHGGWHDLNTEAAKRYLKVDYEISTKTPKGGVYSPADVVLRASEQHHRVDLVGAYAGYRESKIYTLKNGLKMLVPRMVKIIEPSQGYWGTIGGFLEGLLPNPIELAVFRAWLRHSYLHLQQEPGEWGPGQALVLIGNTGTGKTACQQNIITPLLGRDADPTSWFTGLSTFNSHLAESEHWCLSDPQWSTKTERENFANALKKAVSDSSVSVHPKYEKEFSLPVFKRVSISLNEDEEALSIFPLMPESILEKLIFLNTAERPTYTTPTGANYAQWVHDVRKELPAFLFDTLHIFEVPEEIKDRKGERYGIRYRNEKIQSKVSAPTTEEREAAVDDLVRAVVFPLECSGQDQRSMSPAEFLSNAHKFDFALKEAASFTIPKEISRVGKFLKKLTMRECHGFQVFSNGSTAHPRYIFQRTQNPKSNL